MTITLGTQTLPPALVWEDETAWAGKVWTSEYTLTGALIVESYNRLAGRPVTLVGGENFCPIKRSDLLALRAYMQTIPETGVTLNIHSLSALTVIPAPGDGDYVECYQYPVVLEHGASDPTDDTLYFIAKISLIAV